MFLLKIVSLQKIQRHLIHTTNTSAVIYYWKKLFFVLRSPKQERLVQERNLPLPRNHKPQISKAILATYNFVLIKKNFESNSDWANLKRFEDDNKKTAMPTANENRIVFMGNSITEGWSRLNPDFWKGKPYINRGISGQTTPQMLLRFKQDVIDLKPKVVVILAGINDIAGNTGPMTLEQTRDNIIAMAQLAKANGIKVILSSVIPAFDFPWRPGMEPAEKVVALNKMIKSYCDKNKITYLDYHSAMKDERNGLKSELGYDGVHPNLEGYKIMGPLAEQAIKTVLTKK